MIEVCGTEAAVAPKPHTLHAERTANARNLPRGKRRDFCSLRVVDFAPNPLRRESIMTATMFELTDEERAFLRELLEKSLKDARVEEHRTRTLSYREYVLKQERLLESLLNKLGK